MGEPISIAIDALGVALGGLILFILGSLRADIREVRTQLDDQIPKLRERVARIEEIWLEVSRRRTDGAGQL